MRKTAILLFTLLAMSSIATTRKLSPWLRQAVRGLAAPAATTRSAADDSSDVRLTCAFVRASDETVLARHGAKVLAQFGDIYIVSVPLNSLEPLAKEQTVDRIEARRPCAVHMDSTARHINALPVYAGTALPHPFTGQGVVMGVMDIGFDLTHPNFFSTDMTRYRIHALWDQLATDTVGSPFFVGRDYQGRDELLALQHSRDGLEQTHGTNTLGMAAGSGYDTPYRGMAFESDICLVNNAVSDHLALIDSLDLYKYTSATDALGFKYIFDQAKKMGKPCVINFSEGSHQDLTGDDQLYYAVLDSLCGPGRIIVASAGNDGNTLTYFHKPWGQASAGTFLRSATNTAYVQLSSQQPFDLRLIVHSEQPDTIVLHSRRPIELPDSELIDTLALHDGQYVIDMMTSASHYNERDTVVDLAIVAPHSVGGRGVKLSVEAMGEEADVECFTMAGIFINDDRPGSPLNAAEATHNVHSPSSAPTVVSVGATSWRTGFANISGEWQDNEQSTTGQRNTNSSVGPTKDGLTKPDVMAPGTNIISSYSSYYLEAHPDATDNRHSTVSTTTHDGRTYPWTANTGTSMSSPVVGGAIALWLQAKPDLTPAEALETIRLTSHQPDASLTYPNTLYGHGEINVYRGLLHLLGISAIAEVSTTPVQSLRPLASPSGTLRLQAAATPRQTLTLRLYALGGQQLATWSVAPAQWHDRVLTLPLPATASGIVALQADSDEPALSGSLLIRTQ